MSNFSPLTPDILVALPAGHPIFYRSPDGSMSIEHTVLNGPARRISRTVTLGVQDAQTWEFDPREIQAGNTIINRTTKSRYTVTSVTRDGDAFKLVAFSVSEVPAERVEHFSLDPKV